MGQRDLAQGINVEVGQTQGAVDVTIVVKYPHPLQKVADDVRETIYAAVEEVVLAVEISAMSV